MAPRELVYYFGLGSPWSYLGHDAAMTLVRRYGIRVVWRPMDLTVLFPQSGGLPLAKRHPKRQTYRDIELQRWRARRGVPLNLRPAFWPLDVGLANRTVIALAERNDDPDPFVRRAFAGIWAEEADLTDPATVERILAAAGSEATALDAAQAPETADIYARNTEAALEAGVFGAPSYVLDGEPFWGQDRLELLEEAIVSQRSPLLPEPIQPPRKD